MYRRLMSLAARCRKMIWRNYMESNVLIVDDDKDIRNLISVYLENEGLHTQKAKDAIEALNLLGQKNLTS